MVEDRQDLGLAVLTSSAVFGAWSAWNSSLFTAATFVDNEEKYRNAKLAMDLGLITAVAAGLGVYLVYGEKGKIASISAILTGLLLYTTYYCKMRSNPKISEFMMSMTSNDKSKIKKENISLLEWKPLTEHDFQIIRNLTDNPIKIVSRP